MSAEQVESFFKKVADDEALQEQMRKLAQEKQGEDLEVAICAMGAAHGVVFSAEELTQFYRRFVIPEGELDDAVLEQVNAGLDLWNPIWGYIFELLKRRP